MRRLQYPLQNEAGIESKGNDNRKEGKAKEEIKHVGGAHMSKPFISVK